MSKMSINTEIKKGDYIVYSSEFDCGVFLIENDEQIEQASIDTNVKPFKGSDSEAREIIDLMGILIRLEDNEENQQRIELLRSNIKLMCSKHI